MIETPRDKLAKCQNDVYKVGSVGSENASNVASIKKSISRVLAQAEEHSSFVQDYLNTAKTVRKTMFFKVYRLGVR